MLKLLNRLSTLRIVVIGDLMLDHYIWGEVERISPEAPVPVVRVERDAYAAGGAANVALNLAALGAQVRVLGYLGNDTAGRRLGNILGAHKVDCSTLSSKESPTIIKTRVMARSQQVCRIDREAPRETYMQETGSYFDDALDDVLDGVDRTAGAWSASFDATWEADVWGKFARGVEAADANLAATLSELRTESASMLREAETVSTWAEEVASCSDRAAAAVPAWAWHE